MHRLRKHHPSIENVIHFDIQNVADYYFSYNTEHWNYEQFNLAPPFDFFTTKYKFPRIIRSKREGEIIPNKKWFGSEILTSFEILPEKLISTPELMPPQAPEDSKWYVGVSLFWADKDQIAGPVYRIMCLNKYGMLYKGKDGGTSLYRIKAKDDYSSASLGEVLPIAEFFEVSCLAFNFLNCKNVEIIEPIIPRKKKFKPTRRKPFQVHYHQLKVNAIGTTKQYEKSSNKTDIKQSLHIVRGHFRECGINGKGKLFGKYTGTYWIANHMRGDVDIGIVQKDYKLE